MRLCASIPCMSVLTCVLWNLQLRNVAVSARGRAQYLEPRPYSASPVGTSFAEVGFGRSSGDILFDPRFRLLMRAPRSIRRLWAGDPVAGSADRHSGVCELHDALMRRGTEEAQGLWAVGPPTERQSNSRAGGTCCG